MKGENTLEEEESDESEAGDWQEPNLHRDIDYKPEPDFIENSVIGKPNLPGSIDEINGFHRLLLPNLPNTEFHTETKLKWCKQYNLVVGSDFLEELEKDAEIQLNARGMVIDWKLKSSCPENRDLKSSDQEFLDLTAPYSRRERKPFTAEEDKMRTDNTFSAEEDVFLWKFAVGNPSESTGYSMWKKFKQERQTERSVTALYGRFHRVLLSHLPNTELHPQTKLQLCKSHKIPVDDEFLKKLQIHADIELDADDRVINFTMNSTVPENRDAEIDYDELLKTIPRVSPTLNKFSDEEDNAIWRFVTVDMKNHSGPIPWVVLKNKLKSERDPFSFELRFFCNLAPTLHSADFDGKTKLELYKKHQIPVNKEYLEVLRQHAYLRIGYDGRLIWYRMKGENTLEEEESDESEAGDWEKLDLHRDLEYKPESDFMEGTVVEKSNLPGSIDEINRFHRLLLPNLPNTEFHTETKLKWCKQYNLVVESDFLEELQKDAEIQLDDRRMVTDWKLKPGCPENRDLELSDEEFLELTRRERKCFTAEEDKIMTGDRFSAEEDVFLWKFALGNPSEGVGYSVWKKFKQERQTERSVKALYCRFHRGLLPNLPNTKFHPQTKLQLYKSHKIPVNKKFLKKLQIHADIELDADDRVINFTMNSNVPENKDAEMDYDEILRAMYCGSPTLSKFSDEEDDAIWRFVTVDMKNHSGTIPWGVLKNKLKSKRKPFSFNQRFFCTLAPTLHSADFDVKTKLKLYKKYQIPVEKKYVDILKRYADLEIDENRRIQSYQMIGIDEDDALSDPEQDDEKDENQEKKKGEGARFSPEEDMEIWKFVINHKGETFGMWKTFKMQTNSRRKYRLIWQRFVRQLLPNLRNTKFHTETKLKLCKQQRILVNDEFLEELERDATVMLDSQRLVETFTMKPSAGENKDSHLDDDSFMQICTVQPSKRSYFTPEEDLEIWRYLIDMIHVYSDARAGFWEGFCRKIGSERLPGSYRSRFLEYLAPNLHKYDFDIETKLKLYKRYSIVVDKEYLEVLRQHAYLKIGGDGRIVCYRMKGEVTFEEEESDESEAGDWQEPNLHRDLEYKPEPVFIEDADVENSNLPESIDKIKQENTQTLFSLDNTKLVDIERRIRNAMQNNYENGEATDRVDLIYSILNNGLRTIIGSMDSTPSLPPAETLWSHETEKENDRKVSDEICPKITEEVTPEEELKIWNYVLEKPNCETGSRLFWRDYLKGTIWKSHPSAFMERFELYIVPNLHKTDLDLKSKLALYKKCQNTVSKRFLKTIPEDVSVKLDENGCLSWYKLPTKKPKLKKRWSSPEYKPDIKRYKPEIKERSDKKVDEPAVKTEKEKDEDLVVAKIVPETGVPNPDKIIIIPPKVEIDDSEYEQPFDSYGAAGLLKPKEEIIEEDVDWNHSYQMSPELSAMIAGYVDFANVPLKNQIAHLSESLFSLEKNVLEMRRNMSSENSEEADKEQFFINFKNWISAQKSSKMEEIDRRVESAIRASNELPEDVIYSIFDNGLKMIGS